MRKLTPRLAAVASLVRDGARVADIGTDHALLPVWLAESGRCPAAIASDIGEGPAAAARRTVEAAGLTGRIAVRVGDGLSPILPQEAEDIVIAGMGGETIAAILAAAPWVRDERLRLVLQPMSRPERLRRFLYENGFAIWRETVVAEGARLYVVMACAFTGKTRPVTLADCVVGELPDTPEGRAYCAKQRDRLSDALRGTAAAPLDPARQAALEEALRRVDMRLSKGDKETNFT